MCNCCTVSSYLTCAFACWLLLLLQSISPCWLHYSIELPSLSLPSWPIFPELTPVWPGPQMSDQWYAFGMLEWYFLQAGCRLRHHTNSVLPCCCSSVVNKTAHWLYTRVWQKVSLSGCQQMPRLSILLQNQDPTRCGYASWLSYKSLL